MLPRALANIEVQSRRDFEVDKIPTERHGEAFRVDEARINTVKKKLCGLDRRRAESASSAPVLVPSIH